MVHVAQPIVPPRLQGQVTGVPVGSRCRPCSKKDLEEEYQEKDTKGRKEEQVIIIMRPLPLLKQAILLKSLGLALRARRYSRLSSQTPFHTQVG